MHEVETRAQSMPVPEANVVVSIEPTATLRPAMALRVAVTLRPAVTLAVVARTLSTVTDVDPNAVAADVYLRPVVPRSYVDPRLAAAMPPAAPHT